MNECSFQCPISKCRDELMPRQCVHSRYTPMTVNNVEVLEGKPTELNFTLAPLMDDAASAVTSVPVTGAGADSANANTNANTTITTKSTSAPSTPTGGDGDGTSPETSGSDTTGESGSSSDGSSSAQHEPLQPQDFRHHHYDDMTLFLRKYNTEYPSITRLYSVGQSVEGRELYVMEITDNPGTHEPGTPDTSGCTVFSRLCVNDQLMLLAERENVW